MINLLKLHVVVPLLCLLFSSFVPVSANESFKQITQKVNSILDGSGQVLSVTPVEGFKDLFEVVVKEPNAQRVLYANSDGSRVVLGSLINTQTMANLTAQKMEDINRIDFNKDLKQELALKSVYGNGKRKIAIFEDPRCGYCKQLRQLAIEKLKNATVYTYVYPVLGESSIELSSTLLCAKDPSEAWRQWMVNNKEPTEKNECKPPVNALVDLGKSLGITGTPTIFFEDGTRVNGAIDAAELNRRMDLARAAATSN